MNDQQRPAPKPSYLSSKPPISISAASSAALRGATSAFLPKSPTPTVGVSRTSTGARLAAFAAGTNAQQRTVNTSPERQHQQKDPSPPRGRYPHSNVNLVSGAARPTPPPNTPSTPQRPQLQARSSSTLAARHASAHSRSPHRSPGRSSYTDNVSKAISRGNGQYVGNETARSGALASMAVTPIPEQSQIESPSVRGRILDFETMPTLDPPKTSRITRSLSRDNISRLQIQPKNPSFISNNPAPLHSPSNISTAFAARSGATAPSNYIRQLSGDTVATVASVATSSTAKTDQDSELSLAGRRPKPAHRSSSTSLAAKSLPQTTFRYHDDYKSTMTVGALADAMVASSLASSRAGSPSKNPLPPVPRRRSRSVAALYELQSSAAKRSSPHHKKSRAAMKQTLRKQVSSDDEENELTKRGRRHLVRKHPNMHSEGNRKRWRDKVTELERRRYEGVFAANRGLLIGSGYFNPSPSALADRATAGNHVVNVIVRDIWDRSRLPREVLQEIYDLVSPEEALALNREQFVVGMWLIDQRLKGRKLPVKVSASVWGSVRHSQGIKIRHTQH